MKFLSIGLLVILLAFAPNSGFKTNQLKNQRVKQADANKQSTIDSILKRHQLDVSTIQIFIRVFKAERVLELWAKDANEEKYKLIEKFDFCSFSGELGPKRKQGDLQTPEGFYHIDRFNPWSSFHLSLGINYPNSSDRILGYKANLGGDIFIHGDCVTVGCIPLTDDKIELLYLLAVEARNNGQLKIPVHLFPFVMNDRNKQVKYLANRTNAGLIEFWKNLEPGFRYFEENKVLPRVTVNSTGAYQFR